jgi:hypothetical protein
MPHRPLAAMAPLACLILIGLTALPMPGCASPPGEAPTATPPAAPDSRDPEMAYADTTLIPFDQTWDELYAAMKPYHGPSATGAGVVDRSTLTGKVMAGYQGWFNAPGDGSGKGWARYQRKDDATFEPGACNIDFWPDVSEMDPDELFRTPFVHADGSPAYVTSSRHPKTVDRYFRWMREAGIDGVFQQRFAELTPRIKEFADMNHKLGLVRASANRNGRAWALMYDFSHGAPTNAMPFEVFREDWTRLVDRMKIGKDPNDKAYLHHRGKPVISLWGLFADRPWTPAFYERVIDMLKHDPVYGGYTVIIGCENFWRTGQGGAYDALREVIKKADVISPWTPGRFNSIAEGEAFIRDKHGPDLAWCREHGLDFLPVVSPGFSWHNQHGGKLDRTPRLRGEFLWSQVHHNIAAGADMIYIAMFDEIDEGTNIYKVTDHPPVGQSPFLTYQGLPTDHYLWLAGRAGDVLRGELANTLHQPDRPGVAVDSAAIHAADRQRYEATLALQAAGIDDLRRQTRAVGGVLVYAGSDGQDGPAFESRGDWKNVNLREKWITPGPNHVAVYRPQLDRPGRYRVALWWGDDPNDDHSTDGRVTIHHRDGVAEVHVNQQESIGRWNDAGTYAFDAGPEARVVQHADRQAGNYITLVVRFVPID